MIKHIKKKEKNLRFGYLSMEFLQYTHIDIQGNWNLYDLP